MDLITREEAAQILRVSVRTIDRHRSTRKLGTYRVASRVRVKRAEVLALVKKEA